MKNGFLITAVIAAIGLTNCNGQVQKETTPVVVTKMATTTAVSFGVRGNCGMCKSTIEEAASSVEGVATAVWDVEKKNMNLSFDASKTTAMAVHTAIAASGYDTDKVLGNLDAYETLPGCCKYDHAMKMNQ